MSMSMCLCLCLCLYVCVCVCVCVCLSRVVYLPPAQPSQHVTRANSGIPRSFLSKMMEKAQVERKREREREREREEGREREKEEERAALCCPTRSRIYFLTCVRTHTHTRARARTRTCSRQEASGKVLESQAQRNRAKWMKEVTFAEGDVDGGVRFQPYSHWKQCFEPDKPPDPAWERRKDALKVSVSVCVRACMCVRVRLRRVCVRLRVCVCVECVCVCVQCVCSVSYLYVMQVFAYVRAFCSRCCRCPSSFLSHDFWSAAPALSLYLSIYLSVCLSVCLSVYVSICVSLSLSLSLSLCLALSVFLSIFLFLSFAFTLSQSTLLNAVGERVKKALRVLFLNSVSKVLNAAEECIRCGQAPRVGRERETERER